MKKISFDLQTAIVSLISISNDILSNSCYYRITNTLNWDKMADTDTDLDSDVAPFTNMV